MIATHSPPSWKRDPKRPPNPASAATRRPSQSALNRVVRSAERQAVRIARRYADGDLTAQEFGDAMDAMLLQKHARAAVLGRHRAGDFAPLEPDDLSYASLVMDGESEFLDAFSRDLQSGRYVTEDGLDLEEIVKRCRMYCSRIAGTANETFVAASTFYTFIWRMGGAENHCPDCPALAANSPYDWQQLPTVPRANGTACLFNCKCFLIRSDGITSFRGADL